MSPSPASVNPAADEAVAGGRPRVEKRAGVWACFSRRKRRARRRKTCFAPAAPAFLHELGYDRAVAALESVTAGDDRQPRRFGGLWWDPAAKQLGWSDGLRRGVRQLDHQVWSAWLHAGGLLGLVGAWMVEHQVCLEDNQGRPLPPGHGPGYWLVIDGTQNWAWVAVWALARQVVRRQQLAPTAAEIAELDGLANDPALTRFYL